MARGTKRLLVSLLSGLVSMVGLNLYHFRFALLDKKPIFPLASLVGYESPTGVWLGAAGHLAYIGIALIAGACLVEVYRTISTAARYKDRMNR